MKKNTRILIFTLIIFIITSKAYSQKVFDIESVGIGTTSPTEKLDVVGNIKFSQALMPNGLPGVAGNILLSQGSAASPIWLANGSASQVLTISSGVPTWSTPSAGTVTSITAGTGLTGGTITSSGTIAIGTTGVTATSYGDANDFTTFTVNAEGQLTAAGTEPLPTSLPPSGTAGGDLSGTYPNPSVTKINGVALGSTTATSGNLLIANGTNWVTEAMGGDATITSVGAVTIDGILGKTITPTTLATTDVLEYNGTNWVPTTFPTSLAPSGTASGDLSGTYPSPTVAKINGVALGSTTATTANLLIANGTNWVTQAMSGEATITSGGVVTVTGIQGKAILATVPTTGQVLGYNGTNWTPTTPNAGTVTSVGLTAPASGILAVTTSSTNPITSSGTFGITTTGNSGGIPYFSSSSILSSSSALTQYGVVYGGGAGATPASTAAGSAGQVLQSNGTSAPTWVTPTSLSVNAWALTGNGSTTAGTNFIGTTDGNDLVFKTNTAENMRISNSTGNVVIGTGEGGSAVGNIIRAPYNSAGGNKTGADFTIAAGAPTGKGGSGSIIFQELAPFIGASGSASDLSIMAEAMRITNTGALSFGSTGTATGNSDNVLISGGSGTNPSWGQLNLSDATYAVTGTLAAGNGGTGQITYTVGDMLYASTTTALNETNAAAAGEVLLGNSTTPTFTTLSGDIGTITSAGAVTVDGILGKTITPTTLSGTDILEYNGTNWVPTAFPTSLAPSGTASGDLSGTYPSPTVAKINGVALGSTTATGGNLLIASGSNWVSTAMSGEATITSGGVVTVTGIQGKAITATVPTTSQVLEYNGTNWTPTALPTSLPPSGTASGDLSGTYPAPTVAAINGVALGSTTATGGNLLIASGSNWVSTAMSGDATITSAGAVTVKGILGKTITPTTLSTTDILEYNGTNWVPTTFPTSLAPTGAAGGDLSSTYPNPTVSKINGVALGSTTATGGNLLIASGSNWVSTAMSGDATITSAGAVTVDGILGKTITPTTLSTTDILEYNGTNWVPTTFPTSLAPSGTASGDLSGTYPSPTVAKINGVALGSTTATTANLLIANGTNWVTQAMSGEATITSAGVVTVTGIQGKAITTTTPSGGQVLEYNGTNWTPTTPNAGTVTSVGLTAPASGILAVTTSSTNPITSTGTFSITTTGNSGGIPYFSSSSILSSSSPLTQYGVVYGGGAGATPASTAAGSAGQVLLSNGTSAPTWGQVGLTTGVTGTLPVANGGTGATTFAADGILYGNGTGAVSATAVGNNGQVFQSNGSGNAPTWEYLGGVAVLTADVTPAPSPAETPIITFTIPANLLNVGTTFRLRASGTCTNATSGSHQSQFYVRIGTHGTSADAQVVDVQGTSGNTASGIAFNIDELVTIRTIGTSGTAIGSGVLTSDNSTGGSSDGVSVSTINVNQTTTAVGVNTAVVNIIQLSYESSSANTNCIFNNGIIEVVQP